MKRVIASVLAIAALWSTNANTIKPNAVALTVQSFSHIGFLGYRLLTHANKDLVFSEGQHCAPTRALQVHDRAGAVL
jgi:hypothetical protein